MYKIKRFSIQSGRPTKSAGLFREFKNKSIKYAPIGALVGAGYGAISEDEGVIKSSIKGAGIGILLAALDTALSYFRRKDAKSLSANEIISKMRSSSPITPNDYTVSSDPYSSKLSIAISGGIMVMYLNDLNNVEITEISNLLDEECSNNRYSDYKSERMENGGYLVTVVLSSSSYACDLLTQIINNLGIKINIVSELSESNKSFSLKDKYNEYKTNKKEFIKSIIKKNKVVKNMEKVTPGITDQVINEMSVEPILDRYKNLE